MLLSSLGFECVGEDGAELVWSHFVRLQHIRMAKAN